MQLIIFLAFTGVGSLVGIRSGTIMAYNTRTKICAVCEAANRSGVAARNHECRLNWTGSSKAMEQNVAAELTVSVSQRGAQVTVLVGMMTQVLSKRSEKG